MGRGLTRRPLACAEHPHHPAVDRCDACRRAYCPDCLVRQGPRLLCATCQRLEAQWHAQAAARRSPRARVRRAGRRVRQALHFLPASLLVVLGFGALGGAGAWSASQFGKRELLGSHVAAERSLLDDLPGVAERAATERFCAGGEGTLEPFPEALGSGTAGAIKTPQGAYVAEIVGPLPPLGAPGAGEDATAAPAPTATATPSLREGTEAFFDPMNLVRGTGPGALGWRSRDAALPQQVGFALRLPVTLNRIVFWQSPAFPRESWARDVTLLASTVAPDREFRVVDRWTLARTTDLQVFALPVTPRARYVRLRFQSRQGTADFVSLGGFMISVLTGENLADQRPLVPLPLGYRATTG